MAIAFDACTIASGGATTFAHTCTGSNRILFFVGHDGNTSAVTYAGVSMSVVTSLVLTGSSAAAFSPLKLWVLLAPASGANNLVLTGGGGGVACSYTGAQQTGTISVFTTNVSSTSATALTTSLTTVEDNSWCLIVEWGYFFGVQPTAGTGMVLRGASASLGSPGFFDSNTAKTPAGSYSGTTNIAGSAGESIWHIMAAFAPPATAVTVALTGMSGAGSLGTLAPATSPALSGLSGTGSLGSLSVSSGSTVTLTGITGTGSVHAMTPATTVSLSGRAAAASLGTLTPGLAGVTLTGIAGTGSLGALSAGQTHTLTGLLATGHLGSFTTRQARQVVFRCATSVARQRQVTTSLARTRAFTLDL